jgi:hypothetical protein
MIKIVKWKWYYYRLNLYSCIKRALIYVFTPERLSKKRN